MLDDQVNRQELAVFPAQREPIRRPVKPPAWRNDLKDITFE
jgi:hypothetical protein